MRASGTTMRRALVLIVLALALATPAAADKKGNRAPRLRGVKARAVEAATSEAPTAPDANVPGKKPQALDFSRDSRAAEDRKTEKKIADQRRALIKEIDGLLAKAGPKYAARPDRLYQKAELQWEEARHQHHLALDKYYADAGAQAGKAEPLPSYTEAEKTYRQILEDHPDFPLADEVRFHLGFALAEQGDTVGAILVLEELVKKHPASDYVPDARVALGELFFGRDMLDDAATHFRAVVEGSPGHGLAPFARYKLGWTYYRLQRWDDAIAEMLGAIEDEKAVKVRMSVSEQAFADLIIVWAERPDSWREAAVYYEKKGGEAMLRKELLRYARYLVAQGKGEEALGLCAWLTARDPARVETLAYDALRWRIVELTRNGDRTEAEAARIADFYTRGGPWDKAAGRTAAARAEARALGERAVLFAARLRHETAQRTSDAASYQGAARNYKLYLARFSDGPDAPQSQLGLAEVTFQLGDELGAGAAYLQAAAVLDGDLREEAAYKAVYAYAAAVRKAGLADDATCDAVDDARRPPPEPIELNDAELGLVAAVDRFHNVAPQSADGPEVAFLAGRVLWLRLHFGDAAARFTSLVDTWPKTAPAGDAAALALDCYNRAHRWSDLVAWARRMIAEKRFEQFDEKALRETISGASAQAAVELETRGDFAGAARVLVGVVDDNPKSARNPDRLLAAATLFGRAGARRDAEVTYRRLLDTYASKEGKHDKSEAVFKAAFALGTLYESRGDLARAAAAYEKAADLPDAGDKAAGKAADALFNAAVLRDTLGEGKQAAALYDRYGKDFADRGDAPEIALRAAEALERSGNLDEALARYNGFAGKWPKAPANLLLEAGARACQLSAHKNQKQAKKTCAAALAAAKKAGGKQPGSPAAAAAARAQLALAEIAIAEMDAVKLELPEATLGKRLVEKTEKFGKAAEAYLAVSDFGVPAWGARGIVGLGQAYQRMARALREAPVPPGMTEELLEEYQAQIEVRAGQFDENALDMFGRVADLAREGIVTAATAAAAAARRSVDATQDPWLGEPPATPRQPPTLGGDPW